MSITRRKYNSYGERVTYNKPLTYREVTMYTNTNFKTKKELKTAVADGKPVRIYQPGPFGGNEPKNGTVALEGPHYPQPHRWYATATIENGLVTKVK